MDHVRSGLERQLLEFQVKVPLDSRTGYMGYASALAVMVLVLRMKSDDCTWEVLCDDPALLWAVLVHTSALVRGHADCNQSEQFL